MNNKTIFILEELEKLFPNAECELYHRNEFELLIAVVLSAQTTDERVNMVTPHLFEKYPNSEALMHADLKDVERCIQSIGLYRNKAKNIIALAKSLNERFDGKVPSNRKDLMSLEGVGRKTANVVLSVAFDVPALAVDTHVLRVSKRLGFAKKEDDVLAVEEKLKRKIKRDYWNRTHHLFIFFGRYLCKAKNPECERCPFVEICKKKKI